MFFEVSAYTNFRPKGLERFGRGAVREAMHEAMFYANGLIRRNMRKIVYDVYTPKVYQRTGRYGRSWFAYTDLYGTKWILRLGNLAADENGPYGYNVEFGKGVYAQHPQSVAMQVRAIVGNRHFIPPMAFEGEYRWGHYPPRPLMTAVLWATHNWLIQKGMPTISLTRISREFLGPREEYRLVKLR